MATSLSEQAANILFLSGEYNYISRTHKQYVKSGHLQQRIHVGLSAWIPSRESQFKILINEGMHFFV